MCLAPKKSVLQLISKCCLVYLVIPFSRRKHWVVSVCRSTSCITNSWTALDQMGSRLHNKSATCRETQDLTGEPCSSRFEFEASCRLKDSWRLFSFCLSCWVGMMGSPSWKEEQHLS
jgi:hypothetical protein